MKEDGSTINLPMMRRKAKAYLSLTDHYTALCLPYSNQAFVMYVLLPHEGVTTGQLVDSLTPGSFSNMRSMLEQYEVEISIPRFTTIMNIDLTNGLKNLGIRKAFEDAASFPYITTHALKINQVRQAAKIEVDEQGTKTSAATVEYMVASNSEIPVEFHADRPFVYIIQEQTSGTVLFIGEYMGETDIGDNYVYASNTCFIQRNSIW